MFCEECVKNPIKGCLFYAPILQRCVKHPSSKVFGYVDHKKVVIYPEIRNK